ncbi:hypothetical protein RJ640_027828 [Escallonia rubra]|uniref:AMP-dependent synthetase/ligase domain-containing protein n=1 Tax=Escallonia rubra TaxID=112253 RepID=A0AA88UVX4_9ASTE|nr:hypothetical protein RJ640_027828 [Escallonia rubra]
MRTSQNRVMDCLKPCSANYVPLSPISFLERATSVYSDRVSIIYGDTRYSWRQTHDRCLKLASALSQLEVGSNDVELTPASPPIPAINHTVKSEPVLLLRGAA